MPGVPIRMVLRASENPFADKARKREIGRWFPLTLLPPLLSVNGASRLMHHVGSPWGQLRPGEGLCFDELICGSFLPRAETGVPFFLPIIVGLGIWIGFPTVAAYQDMQSLVSGSEGDRTRAGTPSSRPPSPARLMPPKCRSSMPASRPARSPAPA